MTDTTSNERSCFWSKCSDHKRCETHGSCVALSQAGGVTFPTMETTPHTPSHMEILSAVAHFGREIVRLTEAIPVQCTPQHCETPAKSYTVEEAWRIALTLANNLCVQESDRLNRDDGPPEAMHALGEAARRIRDWMEPGEKLTELLAEGTGRMPGVAAETQAPLSILDVKVTVCSECLTACCWQGIFYCDKSKEASTTQKTVAQLRALGPLESPEHWFRSPHTGVVGEADLAAYQRAVKASAPLTINKAPQ